MGGFIEGKRKWAEETASKPSCEIDTEVSQRMLIVVDEDYESERLFDAMPDSLASATRNSSKNLSILGSRQSDGFLDRTFSSRLVPESVRNDRLIIDASSVWMWPIRHSPPVKFRRSFGNFFDGYRDEAPKYV